MKAPAVNIALYGRRVALAAFTSLAVVGSVGSLPSAAAAGQLARLLPDQGKHVARGVVTGVSDGDTCYVMIAGQSTRVRLNSIDAPEKAQAFGRRSEQSLRDLVAKREVQLTWSSKDRYGRPLVQMFVDGVDVNAEQVRRGMAWVYRQYSKDATLLALENAARAGKLGLWSEPAPVAPWDWRRAKASAGAHGED